MTDSIPDAEPVKNTLELAFAKLDLAISEYAQAVEEDAGTYVDGWVLVTHKRRSEWEQERTSAVGMSEQEGQSWVMTRGLLDVALTSSRNNIIE